MPSLASLNRRVVRAALAAALLSAGLLARAGGDAPAARAPASAAAPARAPTAAAASASVAAPASAASGGGAAVAGSKPASVVPSFEIGVPDLRQRIEERLAAMRAVRAAARSSEAAAPTAGPALPNRAPSSSAAAGASLHAHAPSVARTLPRARAATAPAAGAAALHRMPSHPDHWSYAGESGPQAWAGLKPEYATCAAGKRQSPIDIRDGIAVELEALQLDYRPGAFSVLDTGHTVQVNVAAGNFLSVGGRRYELKQFHFHRPSEERINGRGFEMVAHLVHADAEGRLAVIAVLMDAGKAHPLVQQVWNNLPLERDDAQAAPHPIDPNALLPEDRRYYTYMGSLTTPPCSEGVRWIVMKQPAAMSPEQIAIFAKLYPMNARPLQAASGRLIKESN